MANKKSNPEKGLRTVQIDFAGKQRTLKYSHASRGNFEADANRILRDIGIVKDGMIFADNLMMSWLGNAKVLSIALRYAIITDEDPIKDIDAAIDDFIADGGKEQDLIRAIITAYKYATDPSSVASQRRSWKIFDAQEAEREKINQDWLNGAEKIVAESKAKQTPGITSTDSPSSSLDLAPTS